MTEEKQLKKLEVKTGEVEPTQIEPVLVELGGAEYTAYCPNDFEFALLVQQVHLIERDPLSLDISGVLESFFEPKDRYAIERRCKGKPPQIDFIREIGPTLLALMDHFKDDIEARGKKLDKVVEAQKKG